MLDNIIEIPSFLNNKIEKQESSLQPLCDYCEIACEDSAELCGSTESCDGQGCAGEGCAGTCQSECEKSCMNSCENSCQDTCEKNYQAPKPGRGSLSFVSKDSKSITIKISAIPYSVKYKIVWRKNTEINTQQKIVSYTGNVKVDSLEPETTYVFNYLGINTNGVEGDYLNTPESQRSETTGKARPENWEWYSTIKQNTQMPQVNGLNRVVSAQEWNDFCDRINEFRDYKNLPEYGGVTKPNGFPQNGRVINGTRFTADIWNDAVYAVSAISNESSPAINLAATKDVTPITADHFNNLRDYLNAIY